MTSMIRRMFSTDSAPVRDAEQGKPPQGAGDQTNGLNSRPLTVMTSEPSALVPPEDKLLIFRTLTGIDTVPIVRFSGHDTRTGSNVGIYNRVIQHERAAQTLYRVIKYISSLCMALQIIMGAAVTSLGAAQGSYNAITGLGAVSTITASIVAYIKGTGQPQKTKHVESRWKWIREHIEQRERELCLADCPLDVYREVRVVEEMYQAVKEELEADRGHQNGQQTGPPVAPSNANGGEMSGSTIGRRRSEVTSYIGREGSMKPNLRSGDYATIWDGRYEKGHHDSAPAPAPAPADKPAKE